jgi:glycosyltransferase involved in cell wall biosynthesis
MTRVAIVHSIVCYGAIEAYLATLAERLDPEEFELWLIAPDAPALAPLLTHPAFAGVVPLGVAAGTGASTAASVRSYRRALASVRPDLVHFGEVDPQGMLAARFAGLRRTVVTFHTPELRPRDSLRGRLLRRLAWATGPWVIFTSEHDRETGLAAARVDRQQTVVVPFGVDTERFSPADSSAGMRKRGERLVGTVGLLRRQKRHDLLIEAARAVVAEEPDVRFVVAGEGELRPELERRVRDAALDGRFLLLGQRDDVPSLLRRLDVFVLSSDFEGMCFAVAEAMAVELPVVATTVGGVPQSVVPGETGILVEPGDAKGLAVGILALLRDPARARAMGRAGRQRVLALYALDRMVAQTAEVYRRALARP